MDKLFIGDKNVDTEILLRIEDERDLLYRCNVNKYTRKLCDDNFFRRRAQMKYPNSLLYKNKETSWKNFYLNLIYYIDKLEREYKFDYKFGDPEEIYNILLIDNKDVALERAAKANYTDLVEYFINNHLVDEYEDWIYILQFGAQNKNKKLIEIAISKGANNFDDGLRFAALNQDEELIRYFMDKGADPNLGLFGAAEAGNVNLINYFLSKGGNDWNKVMLGAAKGGHYNLVLDAIKMGNKENTVFKFENGLTNSVSSGNLDLVKYFIEKENIKDQNSISNAVISVIYNNPKNAIDILNYLETQGFNNWDFGLMISNNNKKNKFIEYFKNKLEN